MSLRLPIVYALLALIATAANIGTQVLVMRGYSGPFAVMLALVIGTGVGLVIKYVLDKRYIFRFRARDVAHDSKTFALYTLMGLATTVIFWGFELGFDHLFDTPQMRYLGGVIGLLIGYLTKYYLDKRYVFRTDRA
ncbi:GtrA family protein [Massilia sp. GCM10023247]|uniref:GtrA family protein n=1 Tax=Massilia sp. GCM10023247 TaxID=3252643 RepID=UPI00361CEA6A